VFLTLDYVTLIAEQSDGNLAVNIVDPDQTQVLSGNDAAMS
jgi:hypothetical protein